MQPWWAAHFKSYRFLTFRTAAYEKLVKLNEKWYNLNYYRHKESYSYTALVNISKNQTKCNLIFKKYSTSKSFHIPQGIYCSKSNGVSEWLLKLWSTPVWGTDFKHPLKHMLKLWMNEKLVLSNSPVQEFSIAVTFRHSQKWDIQVCTS